MSIILAINLLFFYLYLGWCWVDVTKRVIRPPSSLCTYILTIIFWPFSLILTDTKMDESDGQ